MLKEINTFCITLSVTYNTVRTIISIRTGSTYIPITYPKYKKIAMGNSCPNLELAFQKEQVIYESLEGIKLKQFKVYREKQPK